MFPPQGTEITETTKSPSSGEDHSQRTGTFQTDYLHFISAIMFKNNAIKVLLIS